MKHPVALVALVVPLALSLAGCAHKAAEPAAAPAPAAPAPLPPEAAGKLHGYLHKLECGALQDARSCKLSADQERSRTDVVLAGDPAVTYDLELRVRGLVEGLRERPQAPGSTERKLLDYHDSYLDTAAIERAGMAPLLPLLAAIDAIGDRAALARWLDRS